MFNRSKIFFLKWLEQDTIRTLSHMQITTIIPMEYNRNNNNNNNNNYQQERIILENNCNHKL